jgi:biotin transport system substrate-specific component
MKFASSGIVEKYMQLNALALAPTFWPRGVGRALQVAVLVIAGTALLTISAKIKVPFYPVPMTLQTFAVMAIAAAYGMRLGVATVLAYLAEGAFGLPVFAGTPGGSGPAYFLGPTGGFLAGFVILAIIVGYAADRGWDRSVVKLFVAMVTADAVVFLLGFVWLAWFASLASGATGIGAAKAFAGGVSPFILGDLLKIALAALLIPAGWRLAGRR